METLQPVRRVQRVRHELKRRDVEVVRVEPLGTELVRVVFRGEDLVDFVSLGFDDHVKFIFGRGDDGEPVRRDYTPRAFDRIRRELTIDFALHGDGHASEWARNAVPGQRAVIGGPRGSMIVPTDYAWHMLAGDATALPAITRRLEELPAGSRAIVVALVDDLAPIEQVQSLAGVERYRVASADELVALLRTLPLPSGEGYVWCAGEAATMARVRDVLVQTRGHPREAIRIAAYWKQGASDFHEDLAS